MKRISSLLLISIFFAGCGKVINYSTDFGSVAVINASPTLTGTLPQPGAYIYIDTIAKTSSIVAHRGNTGYIGTAPGSRNLQVRSSMNQFVKLFEAADQSVTANTASTYILYDTIPFLKAVRLSDDLSPEDGYSKVRFINAALNAPAYDVTYLRTSASPLDSVTVTNQTYLGASPNGSTLSPFATKLPLGTYSIRVKAAGTQTVVASASIALSPYRSIYTFFVSGSGAGLGVGAMRHNP